MWLPDLETKETKELCKTVAKKSKGVCILAFSRGKDSLCAWLYLRKYFKRIIPVHFASYPNLKHVNETLAYYERVMSEENGEKVHILRMMSEELPLALSNMMYQLPTALNGVQKGAVKPYNKYDIFEQIRYELSLPSAWVAFAIGESDSIDRRIVCKKMGGMNKATKTFFPTFDFSRKMIYDIIQESGIKVSDEYRWTSRTLTGVVSATNNRIYKEHYPEDWAVIKAMYPLAEAKTLRERILDREHEKKRRMGILADKAEDGTVNDDGSDVGTDVMTDLGMDKVIADEYAD